MILKTLGCVQEVHAFVFLNVFHVSEIFVADDGIQTVSEVAETSLQIFYAPR